MWLTTAIENNRN